MACGLHFKLDEWFSLEGSSVMTHKQMNLTSSTRTLMPSTPIRCSKSQIALISWMWWLALVLFGKTSPSCSLLSMKACKEELLINALRSSKTVVKP